LKDGIGGPTNLLLMTKREIMRKRQSPINSAEERKRVNYSRQRERERQGW
jgi:hypothetical protein